MGLAVGDIRSGVRCLGSIAQAMSGRGFALRGCWAGRLAVRGSAACVGSSV